MSAGAATVVVAPADAGTPETAGGAEAGRAVPGVLPRRPLRAVDLVIPAHAPAAALAECPAGSVPAAAVPGRVAVPGAAAGSAPRAVGAAASVPAAVPPAAAVPGADNPFAR